jgi:hypothetical protein
VRCDHAPFEEQMEFLEGYDGVVGRGELRDVLV